MRVLLPASDGRAAKLEAAGESEGELEGSGWILVVDDEDIVRQTARTALERHGYNVLTAGNGKEGVAVFREHADKIAAVILDMTMPVMSGEEAFRNIRSIRPNASVILSSGYSEIEATRRFASERLAAFLQKPYTPAKLARVMKRVLDAASEPPRI
jgi:DNA-binding NtrC family response regulator